MNTSSFPMVASSEKGTVMTGQLPIKKGWGKISILNQNPNLLKEGKKGSSFNNYEDESL
jgi:hypothetical protein